MQLRNALRHMQYMQYSIACSAACRAGTSRLLYHTRTLVHSHTRTVRRFEYDALPEVAFMLTCLQLLLNTRQFNAVAFRNRQTLQWVTSTQTTIITTNHQRY